MQQHHQGHQIRCQCGAVQGEIQGRGPHSRVKCYCTDCRAFARYLGQAATLDPQGGCEVLQLAQHRIHWLQGQHQLACLRLSPKGLLRWYCRCCHTPIGNMLAEPQMGFIGLLSNCLDQSRLAADFGSTVARVNTDTAFGEPKPRQQGLVAVVLRFLCLVALCRLTGSWRRSPFFLPDGSVRVAPTVLTAAERTALKQQDYCAASADATGEH